jgi:ATP-binding cassette subfamily F protein 3
MKKEEEKKGVSAVTGRHKVIQNEGSTNGTAVKKSREQKRIEAEIRNKLYKAAKPLKDRIHKIEKNIKSSEERIKEIEGMMSSPEFYKDGENSAKVTAEYKETKEKLNDYYHDWMEETKKLSKIEESIK